MAFRNYIGRMHSRKTNCGSSIDGHVVHAKRGERGASLMEMCIATSLMALVSTGAFSMLMKTMSSTRDINNQTVGVNATRIALDRIGADIRMARSLGDVYGGGATLGTVDRDSDGHVDKVVEGSDTFPATGKNIIVSGSYSWPTWADGTAPTSFTLGPQTLVVQVPVFDWTGLPTEPLIGGVLKPCSNVETHVYRIVRRAADPPGQYCLQFLCVPGTRVIDSRNVTKDWYGPSTKDSVNKWNRYGSDIPIKPTTILSGIVGPFPKIGAAGLPTVFQYINKYAPGTSYDSIPPADRQNIADYTTVGINLEISKNESGAKSAIWAVKQDVSIRNNAQATDAGKTN